jgi:D-alanyl-D-alanine dipeptidase
MNQRWKYVWAGWLGLLPWLLGNASLDGGVRPSDPAASATPTASTASTTPTSAPSSLTEANPTIVEDPALRSPPEGFVDLQRIVPRLKIDIRYHTANNFTGAPLPGYGAVGVWLLAKPAEALVQVAHDLEARGLGLKVYDAYRPRRATLAMDAWAERNNRVDLLDQGYVARHSGHNLGNTIDLTFYELATGREINMGTPFDTFSKDSHPLNAKGQVLKNRMALRAAMEARGFKHYVNEWWHFLYPPKDLDTGARDVPYSCFEPDEGQWSPPADWDKPGSSYVAPSSWPEHPTCSSNSTGPSAPTGSTGSTAPANSTEPTHPPQQP